MGGKTEAADSTIFYDTFLDIDFLIIQNLKSYFVQKMSNI